MKYMLTTNWVLVRIIIYHDNELDILLNIFANSVINISI